MRCDLMSTRIDSQSPDVLMNRTERRDTQAWMQSVVLLGVCLCVCLQRRSWGEDRKIQENEVG